MLTVILETHAVGEPVAAPVHEAPTGPEAPHAPSVPAVPTVPRTLLKPSSDAPLIVVASVLGGVFVLGIAAGIFACVIHRRTLKRGRSKRFLHGGTQQKPELLDRGPD